MKINKKDVCVFTAGAVVGTVVGGVTVIYKALSSKTIGDAIAKALAKKAVDTLYEKPDRTYRDRSKYVSYRRRSTDEAIFATRKDAEKVREELLRIINCYGQVSVADFYAAAELDDSCWPQDYGWVDSRRVEEAPAVRVRDGWILKLPAPTPIC